MSLEKDELLLGAYKNLLSAVHNLVELEKLILREHSPTSKSLQVSDPIAFWANLPLPDAGDDDTTIAAKRRDLINSIRNESRILDVDYFLKETAAPELQKLWKLTREIHEEYLRLQAKYGR